MTLALNRGWAFFWEGVTFKNRGLLRVPKVTVCFFCGNLLSGEGTIWLVVSTHLKNSSQIGSFPQVGVKIKNIRNHHLIIVRLHNTPKRPRKPKRYRYLEKSCQLRHLKGRLGTTEPFFCGGGGRG